MYLELFETLLYKSPQLLVDVMSWHQVEIIFQQYILSFSCPHLPLPSLPRVLGGAYSPQREVASQWKETYNHFSPFSCQISYYSRKFSMGLCISTTGYHSFMADPIHEVSNAIITSTDFYNHVIHLPQHNFTSDYISC